MKSLFTLLLAALAFVATAQPKKIHYQGVAVGANGKPMKNSTVGLRLSVLDSLPTGTTLYTETQTASTDAGGLFSIYLGAGTATTGTFANLPWANGNDKFLKVEMDALGGSNYQPMGTTQLVSVPYAMAAGTAMVIDEGTLLRMKNGHVYRLEYDGTPGGYWKLISGLTPAVLSTDTFYVCDTAIWIIGSKYKIFESPEWNLFGQNGVQWHSYTADSIQVKRRFGDTVFVSFSILPSGVAPGGVNGNTDNAVIVFLPNTSSSAGPDQLNLTGTTAILAANTPALGETGAWSMVAGSGGSLSSNSNPSTTFTKGTDSAYTLVWTITGPCGTSQDTVKLSFQNLVMNIPCPGISSVTYAGESYPTVQIGTQCWFAKNLNVGTMINGLADQTNNGTMEKYCYNDDSTNCTRFGGLYQWAEAMNYDNSASNLDTFQFPIDGNINGICPIGWHLPSSQDWGVLHYFLGGIGPFLNSPTGGFLKSNSLLWASPNSGANNISGFSALPAGYRDSSGSFASLNFYIFFWLIDEFNGVESWSNFLGSNVSVIFSNAYIKTRGHSVRCLKD